MATPTETIYAQELEAVLDCLDTTQTALDNSVSRHSLSEALESLDEARKLLAGALERSDDCYNCDGRGFYMGWPHGTCPECKGSGMAGPDSSEALVRNELPATA
jgi:DnaJ-class molecular chaperone